MSSQVSNSSETENSATPYDDQQTLFVCVSKQLKSQKEQREAEHLFVVSSVLLLGQMAVAGGSVGILLHESEGWFSVLSALRRRSTENQVQKQKHSTINKEEKKGYLSHALYGHLRCLFCSS